MIKLEKVGKAKKTNMNKYEKICDPPDRACPAPRPSGQSSRKLETARTSMRNLEKV